jgi:hypothetical protein
MTTSPSSQVLNSYADVQKYLNNLVAVLGSSIGRAPHGAFWNTLSYEQFTSGNVPGGAGVNRRPGDPPNPAGTWKILEDTGGRQASGFEHHQGAPGRRAIRRPDISADAGRRPAIRKQRSDPAPGGLDQS